MQIKPQALAQHLSRQIAPVYVLVGQDHYFLEQSCSQIQTAVKAKGSVDETRLCLESPKDWQNLFNEANSYSLFYDRVLLLASLLKKNLEAEVKPLFAQYLTQPNPGCTLVIKAPNLPAKSLSWLSSKPSVVLVTAYPMAEAAMKQWIGALLKQRALHFEAGVPELLYQYTQGNSLACAQTIEKISFIQEPNSTLTVAEAAKQVSFQCDHSLFELTEACLLGKGALAIQIIRQSAQSKVEASLVLWMLTQEIRLLLQLQHNRASAPLQIPSFKMPLYLQSLKGWNNASLHQLLQSCQEIDLTIKSQPPAFAWQALERLALHFCGRTSCTA